MRSTAEDGERSLRLSEKNVLFDRLALVAVLAAIGMVAGLRHAAENIVLHNYWSLGFAFSLLSTLRQSIAGAFAIAAGLGMGLLLPQLLTTLILGRARSRSWNRALIRFLIAQGPGGWKFTAGMTLALLVCFVLKTPDWNAFLRLTGALALFAVGQRLAGILTAGPTAESVSRARCVRAGTRSAALFLLIVGLWGTPHEHYGQSILLPSLSLAIATFLVYAIFRKAAASISAPETEPFKAGWRPLHSLGVLLAFALLWGLTLLARPTLHAANAKNVILIGIDTLRADHTSLERSDGRGSRLTPSLARLASKATVFENATSQAPWTMPAFASILTGLYPHQHGALSLYGFLRQKEVTLAELLREAGYYTAAVVSHLYVDRQHGFAQGFEDFDERNSRGRWPITSRDVTDTALNILYQRPDKPFFLFVHYFDPHYQWRDHADRDFSDGYKGWLAAADLQIWNLRLNRHFLQSEDVNYLTALYDEEIAFTDEQIGRLLDALRQLRLEDETAVVVVSDHGEEFLERGWLGHTISLYEEVIRVPLVVYLPEQAPQPRQISTPVETRAIFSTVLDYLGVSSRAVRRDRNLMPLLTGSTGYELPQEEELAFSSVWLPDAEPETGKQMVISSVRAGDWKFILDLTHQRTALYNLREDPSEKRNLAQERLEKHSQLSALLEAWMKQMVSESGQKPTRSLDHEQIMKLKALGYL